ncbi:MAG: sulfite exporter TauE/SafE family protein [Syntrophobacteraceae bacterium]
MGGVLDLLYMTFPVSGVKTWVFLPPLFGFVVSFFTSMGGLSGAFLLLPFQMSVLGFNSPSVSGTNLVFNVVAIPSGVYRYIREGRMVWPLTWVVIIGTLPGVFIGAWVRVVYLPDPNNFKFFVGLVLLYVGVRLALDTITGREGGALIKKGQTRGTEVPMCITDTRFSMRCVEYTFAGETYTFAPFWVFVMTFIVGIIGGIYGIGGGAIVAPFFVAVFKMPVYTIAGAALMGTLITSVAGVLFYQLLDMYWNTNMAVAPDWILGALFGAGGFCGMYLGARCQKYVPVRVIKAILSVCILFVAIKYVAGLNSE